MNYSELIRNIEHELDEEYEKLGYVFEYRFIPFDRFNLIKEDFSNYSGKHFYKLISNYGEIINYPAREEKYYLHEDIEYTVEERKKLLKQRGSSLWKALNGN